MKTHTQPSHTTRSFHFGKKTQTKLKSQKGAGTIIIRELRGITKDTNFSMSLYFLGRWSFIEVNRNTAQFYIPSFQHWMLSSKLILLIFLFLLHSPFYSTIQRILSGKLSPAREVKRASGRRVTATKVGVLSEYPLPVVDNRGFFPRTQCPRKLVGGGGVEYGPTALYLSFQRTWEDFSGLNRCSIQHSPARWSWSST